MKRRARFEVVRTNAGWSARFIAGNGREVWRTSEVYTKRAAAMRAIALVSTALPYDVQGSWFISTTRGTVEVRILDERTTP